MNQLSLPTTQGIASAAHEIDPVFLATPLMETDSANRAMGCRLFVKVETLNPIRSFKGRGAHWWMAHHAADSTPIVSASAGNFGQGLAFAARRHGRRMLIFAAEGANPMKVAAMRGLGAEVILEGVDFDAAKTAARLFAQAHGFLFVEDGGDPFIAEGAGTIGKEIVERLEETGIALDVVILPLGNGALLTGIGTWIRSALPSCRIIGVVADGAPAMKLSWEQDRLETTPAVATIADGIAVREPVAYALQSMKSTVDDVLTITDAAILEAMAFCQEHFGLIVEPAGAAGIAALLANRTRFAGQTVTTVLCGSNVMEPVNQPDGRFQAAVKE